MTTDPQQFLKLKIAAIVVTRNRCALLQECLAAVVDQTHPVSSIYVIDNASDDETRNWFTNSSFGNDTKLFYHRSEVNLGGAGGFSLGIEMAFAANVDWFWIMDDDCIPHRDCLEQLLKPIEILSEEITPWIVASRVDWIDGDLHPMNIVGAKLAADKLRGLKALSMGFLSIRACTFVSSMVSRKAVQKFGLPRERYFIWCDDIEFTARILKNKFGVMAPLSIAVHKTQRKYSTLDAAPSRFFYHARNNLWMLLKGNAYEGRERRLGFVSYFLSLLRYAFKQRFRPTAIWAIFSGFWSGVLFSPGPIAFPASENSLSNDPASLLHRSH